MWNILRIKNQDIILWTKNLRGEKENMQYVHENMMTCFSSYKRNIKENVIPMYWHSCNCEVKIYKISIQTLTDA